MSERVEVIEDDIDRIRARMESRMAALGGELSPSSLVQGILGSNGQSSDNLRALAAQAKANPLAAGLIGVGIAAYFMTSEKRHSPGHANMHSDDAAERVGEHLDALHAQASEMKQDASVKASVAKAQVRGKVHAAKAAMSSVSDSLSETVGNARASLGSKTAEFSETVEQSVRRTPLVAKARAEGAVDWVKENPVPAGLMALAAGAALSSIFSARKTTSRLDASRELHEEAREHSAGDRMRGRESLQDSPVSTKAKSAATKKSRAKKNTSKAKASTVKPKPIPTRTAKARTLKGKPELPIPIQSKAARKSSNSSAKNG